MSIFRIKRNHRCVQNVERDAWGDVRIDCIGDHHDGDNICKYVVDHGTHFRGTQSEGDRRRHQFVLLTRTSFDIGDNSRCYELFVDGTRDEQFGNSKAEYEFLIAGP